MSALQYLNFFSFLGYVVPGLIFLYVRSQLLTGRRPSHSEALFSYVAVTAVYYTLVFTVVKFFELDWVYSHEIYFWILLIFVIPVIAGLLFGINAQQGWSNKLLSFLCIKTVHNMPTAWDWKFSNMEQQWVLVTLKNGTRFAGFCGDRSFISSIPSEQDIYIQHVYDMDEDDEWHLREDCSVLITSGEVSTIEFWPYSREELK